MSLLLSYLSHFTRLIFLWLGLNSIGFAEDYRVGFGIYSFSSSPVEVSGLVNFADGQQIELSNVPTYIKQVLLSSSLTNSFKKVYSHLYKPEFLKQLKTCPFLGIPYELDGNPATKEWFVATLFYGCIKQYNNYMSAQPHNWILQQDAKKNWKVLMESDGRLLSLAKNNIRQKGYDKLSTDHYVVNFASTAKPQCGRQYIEWIYHQNHYQVTKHRVGLQDCEGLFEFGEQFDMFPQAARDKNEAKAKKAVELIVNPWLKQLQAAALR